MHHDVGKVAGTFFYKRNDTFYNMRFYLIFSIEIKIQRLWLL